jgi:2-methylcitrate dehydratase PrpD
LPYRDRFEALLSARYVTSVILHDTACGLAQFTDKRIADTLVTSFARDRVTVSIDGDVVGTGAAIRLQLADGRVLDQARPVPRGDASDPLSIDDVTAKMMKAAQGVLDESEAKIALERLLDIENVEQVDGRLVGSRVKAAR